MLDLLGYFASALIATSLLMRSIVRLRVINLCGAATFSVYGFWIGAYPVGVLNLLTASINVVQLYRLRRRAEIFRVLEVRPTAEYLRYFIEFERREIARFFPRFRYEPQESMLALVVLRDLVPAGVLLGDVKGQTLYVQLDYVVAQYRDLKVARFLFFDQVGLFRGRGIRTIVSRADNPAHAAYLKRIGFAPAGDSGTWTLTLD
jgi:hypothetical protein